METSFVWDDVGSWEALESLYYGDNVVIGKHIGIDTNNCIIHSEKQLVATIGIENIVIVTTDDAILVVPKNKTAQVKDLVNVMKKIISKNTYNKDAICKFLKAAKNN